MKEKTVTCRNTSSALLVILPQIEFQPSLLLLLRFFCCFSIGNKVPRTTSIFGTHSPSCSSFLSFCLFVCVFATSLLRALLLLSSLLHLIALPTKVIPRAQQSSGKNQHPFTLFLFSALDSEKKISSCC